MYPPLTLQDNLKGIPCHPNRAKILQDLLDLKKNSNDGLKSGSKIEELEVWIEELFQDCEEIKVEFEKAFLSENLKLKKQFPSQENSEFNELYVNVIRSIWK